jgi:putative hemolysin
MQLVWLDLTDSPDEIREKIKGEIHSVYPVCRNTVDEVVGVVLMKDIFQQVMENRPLDLEELIKEPQYLPDSSSAYIALERLQENRQHYSMVIDEYGALQGIVTLNDLMDALVGDVSDTNYDDETSIVQREDGTYITDAQMPFYDFLSYFDQLDLYNENMPFNTIGGLLLEHFGHVPKTGEIIFWHGFKFEIFDMDGARIDKVLVTEGASDSTDA